jgi:hypothetical protein
VTACEPGREFGFEVLLGERPVNNWHYRFASVDGGTDVIESFRMTEGLFTTLFGLFGGQLRQRRNVRDMRKTLERIKARWSESRHAGANQGRRGSLSRPPPRVS